MAERQVKVRLSAQVQGYVEGMKKAAEETREVGSEADKLAQKREAFEKLGRASMAMGAAAAVGVGLAVSKWADFDQAMSQVQAATHESESNMRLLSDAALDAGARTVFSAEEAANAIEELAKAGVSTADILNGGLDGALDLAAAGGLGVADAAGIAATALKTFKLEGEDMAHVADLLAAGAGKAMGDVTDLSAALNQSAMVANATGLSIEETTAGLAAFASQGLLGSDAGTSFKTMLMSLSGPTGKAKEEMERLGISAFDAGGNFVGLAEFAGTLEAGLAGMSKEQQQATLKTIFGSDAIRAATVLYSEGEEGIRDWIEAVDDQGYAAETAAARLDNLKGDIEALGGALDTALIKTGSAANEALRETVQAVTSAIDAYNELPPTLQSAALGAGILVAGIGLLGGGALLVVPKLAQMKLALVELGMTAQTTTGMLSTLGKAVGIAGLVYVLGMAADAAFEWSARVSGAAVSADELAKAMTEADKAAATLGRTLSGQQFDFGESWNTQIAVDNLRALDTAVGGLQAAFEATDLGNAMTKITSLGMGGKLGQTTKNIEELDAALSQMVASGNADKAAKAQAEFAAMAREADWSTEKIREALPQYAAALGEAEAAAEAGAEATGEQANALEVLQGVASDTSDAVSGLAAEIRGFGSEQIDAGRAALKFEEELAALNARVAEGATGLDRSTEVGRANEKALYDMATATNQAAAAADEAGQGQEVVNGILARGRDALGAAAGAFGATTEKAQEYQNTLIATPETVATAVALNGAAEAEAKLQSLTARRQAIIDILYQPGQAPQWSVPMKIPSADGNIFAYEDGGISEYSRAFNAVAFADGGFPTGIYSGGPPIHKFAEPETGWEAYISGKPSERDRNRGIWVESGERLGAFAGIERAVSSAVAAALGTGAGGTQINQTNYVTQVERDPRLVMRQFGRELMSAMS